MIAFDLQCSKGHSFEGWFKDLESFTEQQSKGMITCPICKDKQITRVLSPVSIKSRQGEDKPRQEDKIDYQKLAQGIMEYIHDHFEDVGTDFTKEALKIHYGVADKRNIRGTATAGEEDVLKEEGIKFFKFPFTKKKDGDD
ncbi:MAG: DUF1178 domain-containing protein [Deltaproteobacteria bacterium]|nr:MAG: DUF1178 domain-containing protein [Deltaproteobacteria bacterium]